jgi:phospholipase C
MAQGSWLAAIDHIVVLMLENRSFDSMLGFLYTDRGSVSPLGHPFAGLQGNESNRDGHGGRVKVFKLQPGQPDSYFYPRADPGEGFMNTNAQLFGTTSPAPTAQATNQGFVTNFAYTLRWESKEPGRVLPGTRPTDVMGIYPPEMLPVLSGLARGYAVCDQWYAPAPTETIPNRAFAVMATSQGQLTDQNKVYTAPSIFTALAARGRSWAVYGYDAPPLTRTTVADITHAPNTNFGEFADFQTTLRNGTLANFVFLEPKWGSRGNSQHPNYSVAAGEQLIHDVYQAVRGSALWPKTLLVVTYDEHGGCFDHVAPPTNAMAPDGTVGQFGFDFKRFGLRVPTVLISPLIEGGTVFRSPWATPHDHTSILATIERRFGVAALTARDAAAPDVGGVLTLSVPRTDDPLAGVKPPAAPAALPAHGRAPSHLENVLAQSAQMLPVSDRAGHEYHHETPHFKTGADAVAYARRRHRDFFGSRKPARVASRRPRASRAR